MDFKRVIDLKGIHTGRNALLMCNGPSLRSVDFKAISPLNFVLVGLNKIHLGDSFGIPLPDYTVVVNKRVINHLVTDPSFQYKKLILSHRAGEIFPQSERIYYINTNPRNLDRFNYHCEIGVHEGWTVTHAALQLIFYMGIRRCLIVGMDHRFATDPSRANQAETKIGPDTDHFVDTYFSNGQDWDLPDLVNSEASYYAARVAFEKAGGMIIDATEDGACQVFLKSSLATSFSVIRRFSY